MASRKKRGVSKSCAGSPRSVTRQTVFIPKIVRAEARSFLSRGQYLHVSDYVKELTGFGSQLYDRTLWIRPFGEFWELKEKGGILGRINVRVYFFFDKEENRVVILSACKKENDGAASPHVTLRLKNRLRMYRAGELNDGVVVVYP